VTRLTSEWLEPDRTHNVRDPLGGVHYLLWRLPDRFLSETACVPGRSLVRTWRTTVEAVTCPTCLARVAR
jgi:hypothetical protein